MFSGVYVRVRGKKIKKKKTKKKQKKTKKKQKKINKLKNYLATFSEIVLFMKYNSCTTIIFDFLLFPLGYWSHSYVLFQKYSLGSKGSEIFFGFGAGRTGQA